MEYTSLTINYADQDVGGLVDEDYWIRLEQEVEEETATLSEVADLVDMAFDLSACVEEEEEEGEEENEEVIDNPEAETTPETFAEAMGFEMPVTRDAFAEAVMVDLPMTFCLADNNGNYVTKIKVYISHPGEQYTLRLDNGKELGRTTETETRDDHIVIDDLSGITLDYPVVSGGSFSWGGSATDTPDIEVIGSTLNWGKNVSGSISASYETQYDLVEIQVFGNEDGSFGECKVLGFYHGAVDELDTESPDEVGDDADREQYCSISSHYEFPPESLPTQWVTTKKTYYCECSNSVSHHVYENEPPSLNERDYEKYAYPGIEKEEFGGYVDCNEIDADINDPEFYEQTCCPGIGGNPQLNFDLPKCVVTRRKRSPSGFPSEEKARLEGIYGKQLSLVPISPADGDCGTAYYTQKIYTRNCCDGVAQIEFEPASSVEVLSDNSGGNVYVKNGTGKTPFYVSIFGSGFWLNVGHADKKTVTESRQIRVYTSEACGSAKLLVSDGCTSATYYIRSTNGKWELQPDLAGKITLSGAATYVSSWAVKGIISGRTKCEERRLSYVIGTGSEELNCTTSPTFCEVESPELPEECVDNQPKTQAIQSGGELDDLWCYVGAYWGINCYCVTTRETWYWVC